MLAVIKKYQSLSETDRLIYRGGTYRSTDDLTRDSQTYRKIKALIEDVRSKEGAAGVDSLISGLVDQYI